MLLSSKKYGKSLKEGNPNLNLEKKIICGSKEEYVYLVFQKSKKEYSEKRIKHHIQFIQEVQRCTWI